MGGYFGGGNCQPETVIMEMNASASTPSHTRPMCQLAKGVKNEHRWRLITGSLLSIALKL